MKRSSLIVIIITLIIKNSIAQVDSPELQLPSSPGMNIIGILNAEISKPGNYTGVYANLISPIISNNGTIPTDLAVEFSPYYLKSRDLLYSEIAKTNLYRDLKISVASNEVAISDTLIFPRLGIGFRTCVLTGKINPPDAEKIRLSTLNDIEMAINLIETSFYGDLDTVKVEMLVEHIKDQKIKRMSSKIISENRSDKDNAVKLLRSYQEEVEREIKPDQSIWDYSLRTGHFLELAGAIAFDFPKNTIGFSEINRWGMWLNYTYRPESKMRSVDFSGLIRISNYSFDPTAIFEQGSIFGDFGISLNWNIPDSKFMVSGEIIGKAGFSDFQAKEGIEENTYKSVFEQKWNASLGYKITPDILWNISLSDINGNSSYLKSNAMQFLMGLSAALAPLKK